MRQNIDIDMLNREKKSQCILVIWGKFYEDVQGWQANFKSPQEVHKRGGLTGFLL
jgi:hypothetical protein